MTDDTTTRATPLRRVACALTIVLALGLGSAGAASAIPLRPLEPGVNDIKGKLGGWPLFPTRIYACPEGLGIQDLKTTSPHSDWVETTWGVLNNNPQQLRVEVHNSAPFVDKWYHVTFRCEGPITDTTRHFLGALAW